VHCTLLGSKTLIKPAYQLYLATQMPIRHANFMSSPLVFLMPIEVLYITDIEKIQWHGNCIQKVSRYKTCS
jgi:hypothetical protein